MTDLASRLNTEGDVPDLHEPDDLDNPSSDYAPFELDEARPISQRLGEYLTEPTYSRGDGEPVVVLQHSENPELTVWISRYSCSDGFAYVVTCWGWDHQLYFEVPRGTVTDVIEQASGSAYWTLDITNSDLLEEFIDLL